ncbi:phage tail protein [Arcobacter sp. YIC-310]|uniref:phage tail protein n=1 Tax=Arcobacter sp. YIC-310 TaxID=3376632 RepID=UPI003C24E891
MAEPLLGEVKMFAFNWAPKDYAKCDGQTLGIDINTQTLYSLLGTNFGGNGRSTFALPDLRGRVTIGYSPSYGYYIGTRGGVEEVTLNTNTLPTHSHALYGNKEEGTISVPLGNDILSFTSATNIYGDEASLVNMNSGTCSSVGGGQPHYNLMPFSVINYCIALKGLYPSRN